MKKYSQPELRFSAFLAFVIAAMVVSVPVGCNKEPDGSLMLRPSMASTNDLIKMALDPDDADKRREGIVGLSQHPRGLEEKILRVYEVVATNFTEDPTVRCVAIGALGRAGNAKYINVLVMGLGDSNVTIRWESAIGLDNVIGQEAVEPLRKHAINDLSVDVRACSAKALRHYKNRDIASTLARCMSDREFTVRHQAHAALVEISKQDKGFDAQAWEDIVREMPETQPTTQPQK